MTTEQQRQFARDILKGLGIEFSVPRVNFLYAWFSAESTKAKNNPLATTWDMRNYGATFFNCLKKDAAGKCIFGVQNYPTYEIGLNATLKTLKQDFYKPIVAHLKKGSNTVYSGNLAMKAAFDKWGTTYKLFLTRFENGKYGKVKSGTGRGGAMPWLLAAAAGLLAAGAGKRKRQGF